MNEENTRSLEGYNQKSIEKLPYIIVFIDEMADLMMTAGKEVEHYVQRLAQMARACGIHLVMATQRPSVDIITGSIKANFPSRISFQVTKASTIVELFLGKLAQSNCLETAIC